MKNFSKICFSPDANISERRMMQIAEFEQIGHIYLVGNFAGEKDTLINRGFQVSMLENQGDLPEDVFMYTAHDGYWGIHWNSDGSITNIKRFADSIQAYNSLLAPYGKKGILDGKVTPVFVSTERNRSENDAIK
jgi:hypothetical protein